MTHQEMEIKIKELEKRVKALEQEPYDDIKEIREVMSCDANEEIKCKMISNILTAKPHYFKEKEPCEDAISREKVLEGLACIAKAKAKSDAQKSMMGRTMFFVEQLPSVSTETTNRCSDAISRQREKNISKGFEDFMIKSLQRQAESVDVE